MKKPYMVNGIFRGTAQGALATVVSLALVAILAPVRAASPQSDGKIRVDVNLVLVDATVKDRSGKIVDGLKQGDFEVFEDGVPQTVSHFSRDQLPLAVAVVVDLSASIQPFLRPLRFATQTALRTLKPEDEVALFTFSDRVDRPVDLTRDKRSVAAQIESFSAGGGTNINAALYEAARYLRDEAPAARRVIVLVSDNVPTGSVAQSSREVEDAILEADSALYSLKIPGRNPLAAKMDAKLGGKVNVEKLAGETGGELFDVEKEGSLYLAFEALIERVKTRYTLGYTPAHTVRDGRFHTVQVRLVPGHGSGGKECTILAKRGYFATPNRTTAE